MAGYFYLLVCKNYLPLCKILYTMTKIELRRVKKMINKLGIKKQFIAKQVGLSPSELSHLISGRRKYPSKESNLLNFLQLNTPIK